MSISLCMMVKDEERLLGKFLQHHNFLFDEIIIVDTGPIDRTIQVAKKFTDKIFHFKWNDDFSAARNFSMSKATKDWILWLDPDERIDKRDFFRIREIIKNKEFLGYSFLQKTYTNATKHSRFKPEEKYGFKGFYIRRICKLFQNNKKIKFVYPVHETVKNSIEKLGGKIKKTNIIIEHFPLESKEKSEFYLKLLTKKIQDFSDSNANIEILSEKIILRYLDPFGKSLQNK